MKLVLLLSLVVVLGAAAQQVRVEEAGSIQVWRYNLPNGPV